MADDLDRAVLMTAPCPACTYVPQSWRNPQPPPSVTQRGQERPGTESAGEVEHE